MPALRRVGHKGAGLIAPGNTLESFDAALAAGVDMIEFDVLPEHPPARERRGGRGRLLLAHDEEDVRRPDVLTLEEGLAHLAGARFQAVDLDLDLKLAGYEAEVVEALGAFGLLERTLVSTQERHSLAVLRALAPGLRLGWSVPRAARDYLRSALTAGPALAFLEAFKRTLPKRAATALRRGECEALMAHWRLVTPPLVAAVGAAGGELYAWTVDEQPRIRALEALGVTGIITNDPRLFASA